MTDDIREMAPDAETGGVAPEFRTHAEAITSYDCTIEQHATCPYSATKGDWRCRCKCHPRVDYAIAAEAGKFYHADVVEPETVWRPVLSWITEEGKPIRYVFTGDNHECEADALAKAETLRAAWEQRDRTRQLIVRVDGEIGEEMTDEAPSYTQWQRDVEEDERRWRETA